MNIGIFFAIIAVAVIWFMLKKTTLGFEIRAVGLNPHASEYAGISAKRTIILSMIISGALAGLGGAVEGLGTFQNVYVQGSSLAIGFNGMAVSLLCGQLTNWYTLCSLPIWRSPSWGSWYECGAGTI